MTASTVELVRRATRTLATAQPTPVTLPVLQGAVPPDIEGVLLRNGPGRQARGGVDYGHPFDGDGFVQRLVFASGQAHWHARWVHTEEWMAEEAADRVLFRGFGTNRPGGWWTNALRMRFKNAANTSVIQHAGQTLALWEGGLPHALDPETLETLGRFDYDGALRNDRSPMDRWLNPELPFAAHPKSDPHTGELWSFGAAYGVRPHLVVHRVTAEGRLTTRWVPVQGLPFVHDFVLTTHWAVFVLPAVTFDIPSALLGWSTPVGSLQPSDGPSTVLLVPRDGGPPISVEGPPGFVFHWAHGFEDTAGHVHLDGMHYPVFPRLDDPKTMAEDGEAVPRPLRIRVDPEARRATWAVRSETRMELPTTAAAFDAPTGPIWGVAAPPERQRPVMSGIGRLNPDGSVRFRELLPNLPGEPTPVCDGRWLLVSVWMATGPSEVWVLDAETLDTVCRLGLPSSLPLALHGTWQPGQSGE